MIGLPGGKVDPGESLLQAIIRETLEETGLIIYPDDLEIVYAGVCEGEQDYWCVTFRMKQPLLGLLPEAGDNGEGCWLEWLPAADVLQNSQFASYNKTVFDVCGIVS